MSRPSYEELVDALRKVKRNGTRVRLETRDLVSSLLNRVDANPLSDDEQQAVDDQEQHRAWNPD